jgi:hypothetical protein
MGGGGAVILDLDTIWKWVVSISSTSNGRSVGIVRLRTKGHGVLMDGQLHAPAVLPSGTEHLILIGWDAEPIWTIWSRQTSYP